MTEEFQVQMFSLRKQFTNFVMDGRRMVKQSFKNRVSMGSNRLDLEGKSLMTLQISSSLACVKALKTGVNADASGEQPKNVLNFPYFLTENGCELIGKVLSKFGGGRIVSEVQCNTLLKDSQSFFTSPLIVERFVGALAIIS